MRIAMLSFIALSFAITTLLINCGNSDVKEGRKGDFEIIEKHDDLGYILLREKATGVIYIVSSYGGMEKLRCKYGEMEDKEGEK